MTKEKKGVHLRVEEVAKTPELADPFGVKELAGYRKGKRA